MRLGVIGFGAIGRKIIEQLAAEDALGTLVGVLVRPGRVPASTRLPICDRLDTLLEQCPDVVIEAASHEAVISFGTAILRSGSHLVLASVGALAANEVADGLRAAASHGAKTIIPAGAIAGLDGLVAARLGGLTQVTYASYKPPEAWRGTPAEATIDLDHAEEEIVFFEGSARRAAASFPKNANVSAAVAIAGLGFDRTQVKLISSRKVSDPVGIVEARGEFGSLRLETRARAFADNPKSSILTAYGLLQCARLGIGIPLSGPDGR